MEWISIKDEMPKESPIDFLGVTASKKVLVAIEFNGSRDITVGQTIYGKWDVESRHDVKVTHWMPLPEPPKRSST